MAKVIFTFKGANTVIFCQKEEKMEDIYQKFVREVGEDIDDVYFIYGGNQVNSYLTFNNQANSIDNNRNEMNILAYRAKKTTILTEENSIKISKEIICPNCFDNCKIKFQNYKIALYGCKNRHEINNILFEEFNNTQKINEAKIFCFNCNNNKNNIYNKLFFKCFTCKQNLCPICKSIHNNNHLILDYDKANYICQIHNEIYHSYCNKCKINLCKICKENHNKNHNNYEVIDYENINLNKEEINQKLIEFRKKIDIFNKDIKNIVNKLNKIIDNIEIFYKINSDILNNYVMENNNYQILENIINIKNNIKMKDIDEIINNNNISNKFLKLMNIYDKISNQHINYNNFFNYNITILKEKLVR